MNWYRLAEIISISAVSFALGWNHAWHSVVVFLAVIPPLFAWIDERRKRP